MIKPIIRLNPRITPPNGNLKLYSSPATRKITQNIHILTDMVICDIVKEIPLNHVARINNVAENREPQLQKKRGNSYRN
jgi:hypothetical protein